MLPQKPVSLWGRKVARRVFILLILTIIARWEAKVCKLFAHGKSCDLKLRSGTSANYAEHLHPLTHVDPLPPNTHARFPRQMKYVSSQNALATRWILPVMVQLLLCRPYILSKESASTIYATKGMTEVFLASIESV